MDSPRRYKMRIRRQRCVRASPSTTTLECLNLSRIERSLAAPSPQRERFLAIFAPQRRSTSDQEADDHRTIVVGEFDQSGFRDKAAKLNQLPRSLARFTCQARVSCRARLASTRLRIACIRRSAAGTATSAARSFARLAAKERRARLAPALRHARILYLCRTEQSTRQNVGIVRWSRNFGQGAKLIPA